MCKSLAELQGPVRALFCDLDGTMSTNGHLDAPVLVSLCQLFDAGLAVVLVTGRPAGWGHALASLLPFTAVITENGGVSFVPERGGVRKEFALPECELGQWREKMFRAAEDVTRCFSDARLSTDSAYREVDLAIDWNEEVRLSPEEADRIVEMLRDCGMAASRSSVHVNYGPPGITKWTACQKILSSCFPELSSPYENVIYLGDSLNDASAFAGFPSSVGVANVRDRWSELPNKPCFITKSREGRGFCELAQRVLELHTTPPTR